MIMDREKLTAGAFAESIGVAQATISHILGPRNKYPSTEVILRLHQRYNDINLEWLLTGQGEMTFSIKRRKLQNLFRKRKNLSHRQKPSGSFFFYRLKTTGQNVVEPL